MIISKSVKYFKKNALINKKQNESVAYKIQLYNNLKVDNYIKDYNNNEPAPKPAKNTLANELQVLNKPAVQKNYNRIIQSKYTSNDAINNMIIANKSNKDLNRIVEAETERIAKNLDYVEQVLHEYEVPTKAYQKLIQEQKNSSVASRLDVLKQVVQQEHGLPASHTLNVNSTLFNYKNMEIIAESLLRQSKMTAHFEEAKSVNQKYINDGKEAPYNTKVWIHTHAGKTTRHMSNHMQKVPIDEPFIVVNDKTLHIDEMMYPSDPAGSFQNAWICYCEMDLIGDKLPTKTDSVNLNNTVFTVNSPSVKFGTSVNPKAYSNAVQGTPVTAKIDVDVDGVTAVPYNYMIDGNKVNVVEDNGKFFYNGLELKEYDEKTNTGKVSKNAVNKHNDNLDEPVKEVIDVNSNEMVLSEATGNYLIDLSHLEEVNGKYYYHGLEVELATNGLYGKVAKSKVDEFNKDNFNIDNKDTAETSNTAEPINLNVFEGKDEYLVSQEFDGVKFNEQTGHWEYKGLWVKDYSEKYDVGTIYLDDAIEHNNQIANDNGLDEIYGTPINTDELIDTGSDYYLIHSKHLKLNEDTGKYEINGLPVDKYVDDPVVPYGKVSKDKVDIHNDQFGIAPNNNPVKETEDNSNTVGEPSNLKDNETTDKKPVNVDKIFYEEDVDMYTFFENDYKKVGDKYYFGDLDITQYKESYTFIEVPKKFIDEYNASLGVAPKNNFPKPTKPINHDAPIDTSNFEDLAGDYYVEFENKTDLANMGVTYNETYDKYYLHGLEITKVIEGNDGSGAFEIPISYVENYNKNLGFDLDGNPLIDPKLIENIDDVFKITSSEPKLIDKNDLLSEPGHKYLVLEYQLKYNTSKKQWEYNGLKVDAEYTDSGNWIAYVKEAEIDLHNKQLTGDAEPADIIETTDYIHGKTSDILVKGKDATGQAYAIDENGRQWVLDEQSKYERMQDELQNQVDMSREYDAVNSWGLSGYRKINHFNYLKKTFEEEKYRKLYNKVVPVLNELRQAQQQGKPINILEDKLNNIINEAKNSDEFDRWDSVFDVINEIKDIDTAMVKAPELQQDTCFIRAGAWQLDFNKIGEIFEWEGYAGVSYKNHPVDLGHESLSYNITILAPKGTKGVRMSEQFDALTGEREWLLPRGQKFRVLEFDEENHTCTIELIVEDF